MNLLASASRRPNRRTSRLLLAGVAAAASALVLAGCSAASTDGVVTGSTADPSAATGEGTSLAEIQEAGVITVGTEGTYKPFTFHADGGSGELTGYDVDVITAVADKLGVKVEFAETEWASIFAGLDAGRFDLIANQVSITDERLAKYDFSTPYTVSPGVVVVAADNTSITSLADLAGKKTAQSQSSNWYDLAKEAGADVEVVEGWAQAVALVEQGRIDATLNDSLTFLDYAKTYPDKAASLKVAAETDDVSENAFVVAKGSDDLVAAIDDALAELEADGTIAEISDKYFGADVSK